MASELFLEHSTHGGCLVGARDILPRLSGAVLKARLRLLEGGVELENHAPILLGDDSSSAKRSPVAQHFHLEPERRVRGASPQKVGIEGMHNPLG